MGQFVHEQTFKGSKPFASGKLDLYADVRPKSIKEKSAKCLKSRRREAIAKQSRKINRK